MPAPERSKAQAALPQRFLSSTPVAVLSAVAWVPAHRYLLVVSGISESSLAE